MKRILLYLFFSLFAISFYTISSVHAVDGEITYIATNTEIAGDDGHSGGQKGPFPIGFDFDFYGTTYDEVNININGILTFGGYYTAYSNGQLSSSGQNNSIYAFWDDLNTKVDVNPDDGKIIYYHTIGEAPNRKFIVQWTNIYFHGTSIQMGTFQVILHETTNNITIQYRDLLGGDRALGNSATIGIKKDNTTYEQYSHNTASLTAEQAIVYTPNGVNDYTVDDAADYELVYLAPPGAPGSPTLVNPTDGTTGITLAPTFEWLPVASATSYTVLVSTVSNFSTTEVNESGITETSYSLEDDLSEDTTYYWRIQSVNDAGSALSPTRSFETGGANTAPNTPTNLTSDTYLDGTEVFDVSSTTLSAVLTDDDEAEQVRYRLQIATDDEFSSLTLDYRSPFGDEGTATFTYGENDGTYLVGTATTTFATGSYYLRIRTEDDAAGSSDWLTATGTAFTVIDTPQVPTVETYTPADNAADVTPTTSLTLVFSEAVTAATGSIHIYAADTTLIESIAATSAAVSGTETNTITITPTDDFAEDATYYVLIDDDAFVSLFDVAYTGISASTTWNFTVPDQTAPTITTLSPADDTNEVAINPTFTITFDEIVDIETGNITLYKQNDANLIETISVTSSAVTQSTSNTVSFTLQQTLAYDTAYYILMDATAIDDPSNNSFAGIATATVWGFSTIAEPTSGSGGTNVIIVPPQASQFSGTAVSQGENGISPTLKDDTLESNADDSIVTGMALSLDNPDFSQASIIPYSTTYDIDIPTDGREHILYIRYYSATGHRSKDFEIIIPATVEQHTEQGTVQETPSLACSIDFSQITTPIKYGASNNSDHVRLLEQFLNIYEQTNLNEDGVYGEEDLAAVIAWQEKHAADVLTPWGITNGTGYIYTTSIEKIQNIHTTACNTTAIVEETPQVQEPTILTSFTTPLAFSRSLERGMRGEDVRLLQQVLNHLGFTIDTTDVGAPGNESDYFGQLTYDAVLRFQTTYADLILAPLGLTAPTGYVGPSTIAQLIQLVAQ